MGINYNKRAFSIMIGIVIVLSVMGSFNFNYELYVYKRNFNKNHEVPLNSANSGKWLPQITKSVGGSPHAVFVGDANNDGYNDIVIANSLTYDYSVSYYCGTQFLVIGTHKLQDQLEVQSIVYP